MQLFIYIDNHDLEDIAEEISVKIQQWIKDSGVNVDFINNKIEDSISELDPEFDHWDLGLEFYCTRSKKLKSPLAFLQTIAEEYEQVFALGTVDEKSGKKEKVCYFGSGEGKADPFEVACYLGL
jgi:hypothetical protein